MKTELEEIVEKYPIKNNKWVLDRDIFVAEISDFGKVKSKDILDPWNRQFNVKNVTSLVDREGEIYCHVLKTTVNGVIVTCNLYND